MNRRKFMGRLGCATVADAFAGSLLPSSNRLLMGQSRPTRRRAELIMLIWIGHSVPRDAFTPETVRGWIKFCADLGISTIFWRGTYVGKALYHSKVVPVMRQLPTGYFAKQGKTGEAWEKTLPSFNRTAELALAFDSLDVAIEEAHKRGLRIYGDLPLFDMFFPGLENDYFDARPGLWLKSRDQQTHWRGLPCYAEPGAIDYRVAEVKELVDRGVDGISYYLESHAAGGGGPEPDSFAFNPPIVAAYEKEHGVNILEEDFDPARLHALNGRFFTNLLRRMREAIGPNKRLVPEITTHDYMGYGGAGGSQIMSRFMAGGPVTQPPAYRFDLEWQKWIGQGIADDLLVFAPLPNAVAEVQQAIRSKLKKGCVFLARETNQPKYLDDFKRELDAIRAGALDGYVIDELKDYLNPDSPFRKLLE